MSTFIIEVQGKEGKTRVDEAHNATEAKMLRDEYELVYGPTFTITYREIKRDRKGR